MSFENYLFATSDSHFARRSGAVCAILIKSFVIDTFVRMKNICVKVF